jgi:hypothetical protein
VNCGEKIFGGFVVARGDGAILPEFAESLASIANSFFDTPLLAQRENRM